MQTLTFTQKLLRQRRFLSSLIPLLALFLGLGASQKAMAQITDNTVTLNVRGTSGTFNTQAVNAGGTNFFDRDFGTFDSSVPADVFQINGATLTIQETAGGAQYDQGELLFRVFPGTLATGQTLAEFAAGAASVDLGTGVLGAGNVRTFTLSAANRNLLASAVGSASPGTPNRFDVRFRATDNFVTGNATSSQIRRSVFTRVVAPANGVTFSNQSVIVDQGNGSVTRPASAFNGAMLLDQKPGAVAPFAFDINTGRLVLKGGSITTTATGTSVVTSVVLNYTVLSSSNAQVAIGTLVLNPTGVASGGVRTYELTTGNVDLIGLVPSAATGYKIAVSYQVTFENSAGGSPFTAIDNNGGGNYLATFDVAGIRTPAPTLTANNVFINPDSGPGANPGDPAIPGSNVAYTLNSTATPVFQGADLSSPANRGKDYDVNSGQLLLNGGAVTTTEAGPNRIDNVVLYYRVNGAGAVVAYQTVLLTRTSGINGGTKTFALSNARLNLIALAAVTQAGTYTLEVYFQANGINTVTGNTFTITDPASINPPHSATFRVAGTPIANTIWTGGTNDNWFDATNWSNGIPTSTKNALIRDLGAGNAVPYPSIYAGVPRVVGGVVVYDNTTSGPAETLNLVMGGTSQASKSLTNLEVGRLNVYGNFDNQYESFTQTANTVIDFAGVNQSITNGTFFAVVISGGGIKQNNGLMVVSKSITFVNGRLTTDVGRPAVSLVTLADRSLINNNNGAQLIGENELSYLRGISKTTRANVALNDTRSLGNMGMTLTYTGTVAPGNVEVTRNTVESYLPISGRFSIRRSFQVEATGAQTANGGLTANMEFRYLDSETTGLNGTMPNPDPNSPNTTVPSTTAQGTGFIPENRLIIFVSANAGNTFGIVGRDGAVDEVSNIVKKNGVRNFGTFTLGDSENPLPVRLTAFNVKRVGTDALVTWETASELNSRGYEVQISTTGKEFRTLASVASAAPNTNRTTQYRYIDTEANKSGIRYYRLRQIDLDGKEAFFNPVAVSFTGKAIETALVAYPNPLNGNEQLHLTFQSASAGKGQISITDMTGRMVRQQPIDVTTGTSDLTVEKLGDLKTGMYLVRLTLPSGQVQNLKVVKQ